MAMPNEPRKSISFPPPDTDLEKMSNDTGLHHLPTLHHSSTARTARSTTTRNIDGADLVNLPSRTLGDDACMNEYLHETVSGVIPVEKRLSKSGKIEDYELVTFTVDDPENPKNWSKAYKWYCTMIVAFTCFSVAFNSSVITANIAGPAEELHVSREVLLLTITVFVIGFGVSGKHRMWFLQN
jgi:hypothetical protein